ncbi:DUF2501 domain-containing protein [Pseudomonas sp. S 311-6]|uniref:DUF2501 domain-containing protein n=1 Tax=Kerstersia gyiorum TaxID=206506 RepID=UPI001431CFC0|nr:DUF2501 domain-containing protein [Kerstersia gyiorum]MCO7640914.1 DUF2501 domain-containing protein [Pseudomonas sp. S 311-6]
MKKSFRLALGLAAALAFASGAAQAQLLDSVKGALGGSSSGSAQEAPAASSGGSGLSGLGNLGSVGNLAGLLQFCVKNNYLSGNAVENVQEKLLGSLGGQKKAESNPDFLSGLQGKVLGSDGSVDLSGGGFKEELTRKACDQVLEHAGSLI